MRRPPQVLKVAVLAEKYAVDYTWYVDTILGLIRVAGDFVSEEVWYRVIQIVVNRDDAQGYAAKTVFEVHRRPPPRPRPHAPDSLTPAAPRLGGASVPSRPELRTAVLGEARLAAQRAPD